MAKLRHRLLAAQEKLKVEKEVSETKKLCLQCCCKDNLIVGSVICTLLGILFLLKARVMAEAENRTIRKNVLQQKINCTLTRTT